MIKFLEKHKLFIGILVLAVFLRFFGLGELGMGFFRDEAALGYNSWSISQTLKDEFGQTMPVVFRSFEVFFLPLYVYLSAIFMKFLGLSIFSTRMISAISGVGVVIVTYFLTRTTFPKKKYLPELTALLVTLSPWTLFYSRGAFEGNLGLFLFTLGVYLFIKKRLSWSFVLMVLSMYSYQAERLVVPLWLLVALYTTKNTWWGGPRNFLKTIFPAVILGLPLAWIWFSPAGLHRAVGVSLLSSGGVSGFFPTIKKILAMYTSYFSPRNLFWELDYNPQRSLVGQSVIFFWLLPGYFYSWYLILKNHLKKNTNIKLLIFWLLLGPLPAALTSDPFHTYRSLLMSVPLIIFISWGSWELAKRFNLLILLAPVLLLFSVARMTSSYLVVTPTLNGNDWDQVFQSTVKEVKRIGSSKQKIVFDTAYSEPYIHYLFFTGYEPVKLQQVTSSLDLDYYDSIERVRLQSLDNVYFEEVDWPSRRGDQGTVFVLPNSKVPPSEFITDPKVKLLKEITNTNGQVVFRLLEII
jgi:4-amino-4-deoxy-L-arabinose transferase-like glycosyltransferase